MENNQPTLDLNDLRILREIVSQCSQRGAFRAEEFTTIGNVYDKLTAFLEMSGSIKSDEPVCEDTTTIGQVPLTDDQDAPANLEGVSNHD
jgi:hypothetical protein